jgi:hypothetical protein
MASYSLPYLFQSIDTSPTVSTPSPNTPNPSALSICTPELVGALRYTDSKGALGSHPNFPPFPLCRTKTSAATTNEPTNFNNVPNPAQASEGYLVTEEGPKPWAKWVTDDWTATITGANSLVKTASSASMCSLPPLPCPPLLLLLFLL